MDLGDWDFAHYLGLKAHEYVRARRDGKDLSARAVFRLLDSIPLTFEQFMRGDVDYQAIEAHSHGNTAYVPDRYLRAARSRRRTTMNILGYLQDMYGWREQHSVLKHFHMHSYAFKDPDALINVHFANDLCALLRRRGHTESMLYEMGAYSTHVNRATPFGASLSGMPNARVLYERVITEMSGRFDENYHYRIDRLSDEELVMRIAFDEEACEALGSRTYGNRPSCVMREGVVAAFPAYLGLPHAKSTYLSCVHKGGGEDCLIHFDLTYCRHVG